MKKALIIAAVAGVGALLLMRNANAAPASGQAAGFSGVGGGTSSGAITSAAGSIGTTLKQALGAVAGTNTLPGSTPAAASPDQSRFAAPAYVAAISQPTGFAVLSGMSGVGLQDGAGNTYSSGIDPYQAINDWRAAQPSLPNSSRVF